MIVLRTLLTVILSFALTVSCGIAFAAVATTISGDTPGSFHENLPVIGKSVAVSMVLVVTLFFLQAPRNQGRLVRSFRLRRWALGVLVILGVLIIALSLIFLVRLESRLQMLRPLWELQVTLPVIGDLSIGEYIRTGGNAILMLLGISLLQLFAKRIWRCPACNKRFPFLAEGGKGLALSRCPSCNTQLTGAAGHDWKEQ